MTARIIDGKVIAAELRARVAEEVARVKREHQLTPGLAVVLVGNDPASEVYVRSKHTQTQAAGMASFEHKLPAEVAQTDLLVDGRYDAAQPETGRRWAGSANQRFHFLTARYSPGIELGRERIVEITLGGGRIRANGWPTLLKGG